MAKQPPKSKQLAPGTNRPMQELFLPVHGHVSLYPEEIAIIDHPSFQRLRRVRQLGFAHVVFPGGTHTRLEHSIGAVHVAQVIIDNVNANYQRHDTETVSGDWHIAEIDSNSARLIRLGALLHDIGHLPFGHTLEDELNHLRPHDGPERLNKIGSKKFAHYDPYKSVCAEPKPADGWSLQELIDTLYKDVTKSLEIDLPPYSVLIAIISKPPKDDSELEKWKRNSESLEGNLKLQVCRDIVGNTICADFLDYLFRDWHHLGKPLYEDKRLYQYMEARTNSDTESGKVSKFVINVGAGDKIRHDALTNILELLEGRYKLAETVLFHRTKLAITALLDRCLLEIRNLYKEIGIADEEFLETAEELLLEGSDDALPIILGKLAAGGSDKGVASLKERIASDRKKVIEATTKESTTPDLLASSSGEEAVVSTKSELETQTDTVNLLIDRIRDRCVYTLAYKLRISDFPGSHTPEHARLLKLINLYRDPKNGDYILEKSHPSSHFLVKGLAERAQERRGELWISSKLQSFRPTKA